MPKKTFRVNDIVRWMESLAPPELSEDWDNTGLLLGHRNQSVSRVMTCLTLTSDVAVEAVDRSADLVVTHHPLMFRGVKKITDASAEGRTLLTLLHNQVAVYSPHTSYDSAKQGVNVQLAKAFGLGSIKPIRPLTDDDARSGGLGAGRYGRLKRGMSLQRFLDVVKSGCDISELQFTGDRDQSVRTVGIACGSAAEFLHDASRLGCDVLVTGEARFHACLEARAKGIAMILVGHYASERPALEELANRLSAGLSGIDAFASEIESDPLQFG